MVGRCPLAGSILPCGLSPLYHEYRCSLLNRPEAFLNEFSIIFSNWFNSFPELWTALIDCKAVEFGQCNLSRCQPIVLYAQ
jgi:hypothetical protein